MDDIVAIRPAGLGQLMANIAIEGKPLAKPFEAPIFLAECLVMGTTLVDGIDEVTGSISVGDRLELCRDKEFAFDELAAAVTLKSGERLGYIPSDVNDILARLLDAGKELYGEVTECKGVGNWNRIKIKVFLLD